MTLQKNFSQVVTGLGQDSHQISEFSTKQFVLGGVSIPLPYALKGNSDADVVIHAITRALSSISTQQMLGEEAEPLLAQGITDSKIYLQKALHALLPWQLSHVALSIECQRPRLHAYIPLMQVALAKTCALPPQCIGITVHSGENLSDFGRGKGIFVTAAVTCVRF